MYAEFSECTYTLSSAYIGSSDASTHGTFSRAMLFWLGMRRLVPANDLSSKISDGSCMLRRQELGNLDQIYTLPAILHKFWQAS